MMAFLKERFWEDRMGGFLVCATLRRCAYPVSKKRPWCRLLLHLHELTQQRCNLICLGVKREVSGVEYVDLRVGNVVALRLAEIEREVMLAPDHQQARLLQVYTIACFRDSLPLTQMNAF